MTGRYFATARSEILPFLPAKVVRLLDLGCGTGATIALVRKERAVEWAGGIEIDAPSAREARAHCERVFVRDAPTQPFDTEIAPSSPDLVLCLDVLEHLGDPWTMVRCVSPLLAPGGRLILSVPNIRNWKFLWRLATQGDFHYRDAGVLDRTHLRFFVRETAIELATCGGLAIVAAANAQPFTFPDARFLLSKASGGRLDAFLAKALSDQFLGLFPAVVASSHEQLVPYFNSSPEVIRLVVMMYVRYPLSLRNVEDLLAERGIDISHETVRFWWNRFSPMFAAEIRKRRVAHMRGYPQWRWHLDEVFVKVNGRLCYLWRAVDHEGEVLEAVVAAQRDKAAALKLLKRIMKKYGQPRKIVTDGLRAYSAAMKAIGNSDRQEVGRGLNNRAENSHQPFRRRERAMQRFRSLRTLQKFTSVHAQVTTISIRSAISSPVTFTSTDALPHWPRGMLLWPNRSLRLGDLRCPRTHRCCSDNARLRGRSSGECGFTSLDGARLNDRYSVDVRHPWPGSFWKATTSRTRSARRMRARWR